MVICPPFSRLSSLDSRGICSVIIVISILTFWYDILCWLMILYNIITFEMNTMATCRFMAVNNRKNYYSYVPNRCTGQTGLYLNLYILRKKLRMIDNNIHSRLIYAVRWQFKISFENSIPRRTIQQYHITFLNVKFTLFCRRFVMNKNTECKRKCN